MKLPYRKALISGAAFIISACASSGSVMELERRVDIVAEQQSEFAAEVSNEIKSEMEKISNRLGEISDKQQSLAISQQQAATVLDNILKNEADIKNDLEQLYINLEHVTGKGEERIYHVKNLAENVKSLEKRISSVRRMIMEANLAHSQKLQVMQEELNLTIATLYDRLEKLSGVPPEKKPAREEKKEETEEKKPEAVKIIRIPRGINAEKLYSQAYKSFLAGRYAQSEAEFADYLKRFPDTDLSDNSQYWLGESQANQGKLKKAAATFVAVAHNYPGSIKAPSALWKAALLYEKLADKKEMLKTLRKIGDNYPASYEASLAQGKINSTSIIEE
jgi:tol-pal system protein YbgF